MGRIVDGSEPHRPRFPCAISLIRSRNAVACPLLLKAIKDPSTDEEFDGGTRFLAKMRHAGLPSNLRVMMFRGLLDKPGGADALGARVTALLSFLNGWLFAIVLLWLSTQNQSDIVPAADVLKYRSHPEALRVRGATALYRMRRESNGKSYFPKAAWDAPQSVWGWSGSTADCTALLGRV